MTVKELTLELGKYPANMNIFLGDDDKFFGDIKVQMRFIDQYSSTGMVDENAIVLSLEE